MLQEQHLESVFREINQKFAISIIKMERGSVEFVWKKELALEMRLSRQSF
jgi:hypothetical protein